MNKKNLTYFCPNNKKHTLRQNVTYMDMRTCDHCRQHWTVGELTTNTPSHPQEILLRNTADQYNAPFVFLEINDEVKQTLNRYREQLSKLSGEFRVEIAATIFPRVISFEILSFKEDKKKDLRLALNEDAAWSVSFKKLKKEGVEIDWSDSEYENIRSSACRLLISDREILISRPESDDHDNPIKATLSWNALKD